MSLGLIRSLCVLAVASAVHVGVAAAPETPAATGAGSTVVAVAGGKLRFTLDNVEARPVPGEDLSTMYYDSQREQAILVTEAQLVTEGKDKSDDAFRIAIETMKEKQHAASPNYRIVREGTTRVKGLDVYRLDGTDDLNGMQLLMATLMTVEKQRVTIIEVMSQASDAAGHTAAVNNILGSKASASK